MKRILSVIAVCLLFTGITNAQTYTLQTQVQPYQEITNPDYEIPDTSQYFGNVNTKPAVNFKCFNQTYNLEENVLIPLKEGYLFFTNATHSITLYVAKGDFVGRPGNNQTSVFSFKTEGTTGNKVFTLQWKNMGLLGGDENDYINFQAKLYESTGVIEYHFGPSAVKPGLWINGANGPTIGILEMDAPFSTIYNQLWLSGQPSNPTVVNTNGIVNIDQAPANNTLYRFMPATSSITAVHRGSGLKVYPTLLSCGDKLHIEADAGKEIKYISLFDCMGKKAWSSEISASHVTIPGLPQGVYFLTTDIASQPVKLTVR